MPLEWTGVAGKAADGLNEVIIANQALAAELARVSRVVGKQGELSQRVVAGAWSQCWSGSVESVNSLIDALVRPTSEMQRVIGAVAAGDLSKKVSADMHGEMLDLKNTINAMVDQLNGFVSELTRVAREVGTEGKIGQAAAVMIEVGGVWKDLTDHVNLMAGNLTGQVRNIAEVTTAVANGEPSKKISIEVNGEFLAKVELGTASAELADLSVEYFRTALVREFNYVARGKGIDYAVEVAPGTPENIVTDPQRLHQILKNLLANAFKFTERGEVYVSVGLSDQGWDRRTKSLAEAPSVIAFSVRDSGSGIPEEEHERIFAGFSEADGTITRQYGGTGLGLSISRELAALMGGEITVASTPGSGSIFTLYLPLGRSPVPAATPRR
jgi:signal transduction histidine kinase